MMFPSERKPGLVSVRMHMLKLPLTCMVAAKTNIWVRIIDLEVRLIRLFDSRMENDDDEASPVISVFSPPIKTVS